MTAGTAAIAAPIIMNIAGKVPKARAEEKKTYYITLHGFFVQMAA
jgi:hypothetical protein